MLDPRFDTHPATPRPEDAGVNVALHAIAEELLALPVGRGGFVEGLVAKLQEKGIGEPAARWAVHDGCERRLLLVSWGRPMPPEPGDAVLPARREEGIRVQATPALAEWRRQYQEQLVEAARRVAPLLGGPPPLLPSVHPLDIPAAATAAATLRQAILDRADPATLRVHRDGFLQTMNPCSPFPRGEFPGPKRAETLPPESRRLLRATATLVDRFGFEYDLLGQRDEVLDLLEQVEALGHPRPPTPTADYCLLPGYRVRWEGETPLQPLLWRVLEFLLRREHYPFPVDVLVDAIWGEKTIAPKTPPNTLSRLYPLLEPIKFPWGWHINNGHVIRDG